MAPLHSFRGQGRGEIPTERVHALKIRMAIVGRHESQQLGA